jgi:hypothetical protein
LTTRRLERLLPRARIGSAVALQCLYPGNACLPSVVSFGDALRDTKATGPLGGAGCC